MASRAEERGRRAAAERGVQRDPAEWGVSATILHLPTSKADVDVVYGDRGRILAAKRSDPFDLLHAAGGLDEFQHRAARRLFRDYCFRAGVSDHAREFLGPIDGGTHDGIGPGAISAGKRIAAAFKGGDPDFPWIQGIGRSHARLLDGLISPMVDLGLIIAWRGTVQRLTGETNSAVQGGLVRQACEELRQFYEELDEAKRLKRQLENDQAEAAAIAGGRVA